MTLSNTLALFTQGFVKLKRKKQNMDRLRGMKLVLEKLMNKCAHLEMMRVFQKVQKLPDTVALKDG